MRVDLSEPLAGHHVEIDPKRLTFGVLEDLQSGSVKLLLDAVAKVLVGGDLPAGVTRDGLRELNVDEMTAVVKGVMTATAVPKR
jgi:hypothetical protein